MSAFVMTVDCFFFSQANLHVSGSERLNLIVEFNMHVMCCHCFGCSIVMNVSYVLVVIQNTDLGK